MTDTSPITTPARPASRELSEDELFDRLAGNEAPVHVQGQAAREAFAARRARAARGYR